MTQQNNEAFEKWFESELQKLIDVKNYDDMHMLQINKHLAWKEWQAATQHSERGIAMVSSALEISNKVMALANNKITELQAEIAELKERLECMQDAVNFNYNRYYEAQAYINVLREALEFYAKRNHIQHLALPVTAEKALASTPEQSLAEHDDEVLERAAKVCDRYHYIPDAAPYDCAKAIREMKGTS